MFGAVKPGSRSLAIVLYSCILNVVAELKPKRRTAASRGFLVVARLSCCISRLNVTILDITFMFQFLLDTMYTHQKRGSGLIE